MWLTLFWMLSAVAVVVSHVMLIWRPVVPSGKLTGGFLRFMLGLYFYGKLKNEAALRADQKVGPTKSSNRNQLKLGISSIPKGWFTHFYLVGAAVHSLVFCILIYFLMGHPLPKVFKIVSEWNSWGRVQARADSSQSVSPLLLVFTLEFLQLLRRLYECVFVSTFSKTTMSIAHYFYGIFLYATFGLGLLAYSHVETLSFDYPSGSELVYYAVGVLTFSIASFYQHKSLVTLANLRNKQQKKESSGHYIPNGHLFEYVSCPHNLCEIIIYLSFNVIFGFTNLYVLAVSAFVLANQVSSALMSQAWYKEHFKHYPSSRCAIIPFAL